MPGEFWSWGFWLYTPEQSVLAVDAAAWLPYQHDYENTSVFVVDDIDLTLVTNVPPIHTYEVIDS